MNSDCEFHELIDKLSQGSEEAAWEITERYSQHIYRAVRRSMISEIRPQIDSQDFVQAVWASFLLGRTSYRKFEQPKQLIAYLAAIARHKVLNECCKRTKTQAYNVRREQGGTVTGQDVVTTEPTPSQVAIAQERWQRLMLSASEQLKRIVELRISGESYAEIAKKLGVNERTVRRNLKDLLSKMDD